MFRLFAFLPRRWWRKDAWKTWASFIHWRLETYGVFYPQGSFSWRAFFQLMNQFPSYYRWLGQINRIHRTRVIKTHDS